LKNFIISGVKHEAPQTEKKRIGQVKYRCKCNANEEIDYACAEALKWLELASNKSFQEPFDYEKSLILY